MGFNSKATCEYIEPEQIDCAISRTIYSLAPVGTVTAHGVNQAWVDRNCDEDCTYRVVLTTEDGDVPVTDMYSSGYDDKRQLADDINTYLAASGSDPVEFRSSIMSSMGIFILLPILFFIIGVLTMARSFFRLYRRIRQMNYRQHRGVRISEIGLGCYGLGGAYGPANVPAYEKVIQRAFDMGVNYFDTAAAYGNAEELLGKAIAPFRSDVFISTKIAVNNDGQSSLTAQTIRTSCDNSLKALRTDYIDLLQIHYDDPYAGIEEVLGTMEALVMSGKIRRYGIGHLPLNKLTAYCDAGDLFSVMIELNAVAREARDYILPKCRDKGIAALAFSVTGRGMLSGRYRPGHRFPEDDIRRIDPLFQRERWRGALRVRDRLAHVGLRYGKTAIQMGIAWVLAQPGVTVALTGPSSVLHLAENLAISGWKFHVKSWNPWSHFSAWKTLDYARNSTPASAPCC